MGRQRKIQHAAKKFFSQNQTGDVAATLHVSQPPGNHIPEYTFPYNPLEFCRLLVHIFEVWFYKCSQHMSSKSLGGRHLIILNTCLENFRFGQVDAYQCVGRMSNLWAPSKEMYHYVAFMGHLVLSLNCINESQ